MGRIPKRGRQKSRTRALQLEFTELVKEAKEASLQIRRRKPTSSNQPKPSQSQTASENLTPNNSTRADHLRRRTMEEWEIIADHWHPFDEEWLDGCRDQIREAPSLRVALTHCATRLAELLDWEFDRMQITDPCEMGYPEYCWQRQAEFETDESRDGHLAYLAWTVAIFAFEVYYEAPGLNDWELYEIASIWADEESLSSKTYDEKVTEVCLLLAGCVGWVHGWVLREEETSTIDFF